MGILFYLGSEQCLFPPEVGVAGLSVRCEREYPSGFYSDTPSLACVNVRCVNGYHCEINCLHFTHLETFTKYQG